MKPFFPFLAAIMLGQVLLSATPGWAQASSPFDTSFGTGGRVFTAFGTPAASADNANAVLRQADGQLVVAGGGATGLELARYNPNGSLDPSFGTGGLVVSNLGSSPPSASYPNGTTTPAYALSLVQQPATGKLVVAGRRGYEFLLARYNPNGTLDPSFGTSGTGLVTETAASLGNAFRKVLTDAAGQLVVLGASNGLSSVFTVVRRFSANGVPDATYGTSGYAFINVGTTFSPITALLDPSGNLVVAGYTTENTTVHRTALVRLLPTGQPDPGFGTQGLAIIAGSAYPYLCGLARQADGKLLVGGGNTICRVSDSGIPDASFGTAGVAILGMTVYNLALHSNGSITAVGLALTPVASNTDFAIARLTSAGVPDASFAAAGNLVFSEAAQNALTDVLFQPDGKLVAVGTASTGNPGSPARFAVVRLAASATLAASPSAAAALLAAYPNPATDELHLLQSDLLPGSQAAVFTLRNALGQPLRTTEAVSQHGTATATFSLAGLAPGVYWLSGPPTTLGTPPARPILVR